MHADERASVTGALRVMHSVFSGEMSSQLRIPTVEMGYHVLLATFCTSRYGLPTNWPEGFWDSTIGRFIYIAFWEAYGERLMLNQDVTKVLGIDLSRVGQVQRLGLLRYIENPWAMHRKQKRRRVTPQMAQRYLDEQRMAREDSQDNQGRLDDEYVLAGPRRRR